jgi:hypothetical protein
VRVLKIENFVQHLFHTSQSTIGLRLVGVCKWWSVKNVACRSPLFPCKM